MRPQEVNLTVNILNKALPGVPLRFKALDIQEPRKADVIPFIEAERTGAPLPNPPARVTSVLFHRLDTSAFIKGLVNLGNMAVLSLKELPTDC